MFTYILVVALVATIGFCVVKILSLQKSNEIWRLKHEKEIRKDSLDRSRSTIRGQATEQLAPYMMEGIKPSDIRFLATPIDFVVFKGLSDILDGKADEIEEIIFVDVKTGKANLTKAQRRIRDCVTDGRVAFFTHKMMT